MRIFSLGSALLCAGIGFSASAGAATISWDVLADGVWDTTSLNWEGGTVAYSEGDDVTITLAGGTNRTITIDRDGDGSNLSVNPGSTVFNVGSGRTLTVVGGTIDTGPITKTGPGTVLFGDYATSFTFDSLTITGGTFAYRDNSSPFQNNDVISVGATPITIDNGGVFSFRHAQGSTPGVTVTNDFVIGPGGGEINTARSGGNPRTIFSGDITLGGDLLLSKGGGGNNEPTQTYAGTITLTGGDRAVRGAGNFANGAFPNINADIVEDGQARQLTLAMATSGRQFVISGTGNSYSGGTVIESGAGFIRVTSDSSLGTGDVTVLSGGQLRLEGIGNIAPTATLSIADGGLVALNFGGELQLFGLILDGQAQPLGLYDADAFPDFLSGPGLLLVIPEPASMALLAMAGLIAIRRFR